MYCIFRSHCSSLLFPHKFGQVIRPTQIPLSDNTQHLQHTSIHVPGGIQTRITSKRAAADHALDRAATEIGKVSLYRHGQAFRAPVG